MDGSSHRALPSRSASSRDWKVGSDSRSGGAMLHLVASVQGRVLRHLQRSHGHRWSRGCNSSASAAHTDPSSSDNAGCGAAENSSRSSCAGMLGQMCVGYLAHGNALGTSGGAVGGIVCKHERRWLMRSHLHGTSTAYINLPHAIVKEHLWLLLGGHGSESSTFCRRRSVRVSRHGLTNLALVGHGSGGGRTEERWDLQ